MKIATWNLERPESSGGKNKSIVKLLTALDADILVLTESNESICLGLGYRYFHSAALSFLLHRNITVETWNPDKSLSDHIGVCVSIS